MYLDKAKHPPICPSNLPSARKNYHKCTYMYTPLDFAIGRLKVLYLHIHAQGLFQDFAQEGANALWQISRGGKSKS